MKVGRLGDHVKITSGFAFKSELFGDAGGLPLIRIRDVKRGFTETFYSGEYDPTYLIENGDLLIGMDGEFNCEKWQGGKALLNQRVCKVVADGVHLDQNYLYFFLPRELKKIEDSTPSVTVKHLSAKTINEIQIPLPPLPEQRRIAAILDKADAVRRKRQETIRLAEEFLRSVFLDMFGDPVTNPKGWKTVELNECLENIDSGWSPRCEDRPPEEGEWGVLKLGAVTTCSYLEKESKALPSSVQPRKDLEVKEGDILFTRKNTYDLVAACALVKNTKPKLMLPDLIFRLRLKNDSKVHPAYLWALLTNPGKRKQIQSLAGGSAGSMPNISKGRLLTQKIEVPPFDLQKKFSSVLNVKNNLETVFVSANGEQEMLFVSLVQRAFRGDL